MPAGIYTRISRDDLGDGLGVERQHQDCRTVCQRRGWTVIDVYVDNDISAYSGRSRPAYKRLLADIASRKIDMVVAWAPERLHRSPRELEDFLELIERTGTAVETVKAGSWDVSTSHGRLVARMLGAVSRAESERTGERVSRAHQQAKERGLWRGPIPFGLRASSLPGQPEPDPDQAPVVKDIFDRVLRGDALTRIARDLNASEMRPRRGQAWTHTGISRLISSPALGGLVEVDGELQAAAFNGVVASEDWRSARAALRRRPRGEVRRPREKLTLLGGLLSCAEHAFVLFGGSAAHGAIYVADRPGQCCVGIVRAATDDLITTLVIRRLGQPDAVDLFQVRRDTTAIDTEIQELRQRREELADLVAEGLLTASAVRPRLSALAERLGALEAARSPTSIDPEAFVRPGAAWEAWTMTQRREVLRLLFAGLAVRHVGHRNGSRFNPERLQLEWAHQN